MILPRKWGRVEAESAYRIRVKAERSSSISAAVKRQWLGGQRSITRIRSFSFHFFLFFFLVFIDFPFPSSLRGPLTRPLTMAVERRERLIAFIVSVLAEGPTSFSGRTDMNYSLDENYIPRVRVLVELNLCNCVREPRFSFDLRAATSESHSFRESNVTEKQTTIFRGSFRPCFSKHGSFLVFFSFFFEAPHSAELGVSYEIPVATKEQNMRGKWGR